MKAIPFLNWTNEDFTWTWDSVPYEFKAKTSTLMEDWKSRHFAKHLTDRELLKAGYQVNDFRRPNFLAKALPEGGIEAPDSKLTTEMLNTESSSRDIGLKPAFCDSCDSKGVKHKKGCPKVVKPVEEVFEGLQNPA